MSKKDTKRKVLTRDDILAANDIEVEYVDLTKEWGGGVYVRVLKESEFSTLEKSFVNEEYDKKGRLVKKHKLESFRSRLAVMAVCDEDGTPIFDNSKNNIEDEIKLLSQKSIKALNKIVAAAEKLNKVYTEDQEVMEKN